MKIWEQITKDTWCKSALEDGNGRACLLGWLIRLKACTLKTDRVAVRNAILALFPDRAGSYGLVSFNNHVATTFEDVLRVLKIADV